MKTSVSVFCHQVLRYEGTRYTDGIHPYDPGGPTKYGITLATARRFWKSDATAMDVKNMPLHVALRIYVKRYWNAVRGDDLPAGPDFTTGDYAINSGPGRASRVLQAVVGVRRDGVIGKETLAAVGARDPDQVIDAICDERLAFMKGLRIWHTYGRGWTRRVEDVRKTAHNLATQAKNKPPHQTVAEAGAIVSAQHVDVPKPEDQHKHLPAAVVPPPKKLKNTIHAATATASASSGYEWWGWIQQHEMLAVGVAAGVILLLWQVVHMINVAHAVKSVTPHPDVRVVPPKEKSS